MRYEYFLWTSVILFSFLGCDRLYGVIYKPAGEEQQNLGRFVFNEYNAQVEELQKRLKFLGYPLGNPDGKFGATTRDIVERFQKDEDLFVTRFVDQNTWLRLQQYTSFFMTEEGTLNIQALQSSLKQLGVLKGTVDGILGPQTQRAIKDFQKQHQLVSDGVVGLQTIKAILSDLSANP